MPLVPVLAEMEYTGVKLDTDVLASISDRLCDRITQLAAQIHAAAGHEFNIDSPMQLAVVLFDESNLRVVRKTKTGRSTDADTLATLAFESDHPLPSLVMEYRELTKLKSTYTDALPTAVCKRTGRVHAGFEQTGAVTGRLSSRDPNLQNIPIRTETGREIRKAFIAGDKNNVLLTADYSQIELRVLAHFCGDEGLIAAFGSDQDIHRVVAAEVFAVPVDEVTSEQRGRAKTVNFGIIYGQGAFGLARQTGMSVGEAKAFIEQYGQRFPGIEAFKATCIADAKRDGYVRTILGRRRRIDQITSRNRQAVAAAERFAVNTVIQGSAADLIKTAMVNIHRRIHAEARPIQMLIQVHDELVFEVPRAEVDASAQMIREEMTGAMQLAVPLTVDIAWGDNWFEGK
jgi:DNA polymerase-1